MLYLEGYGRCGRVGPSDGEMGGSSTEFKLLTEIKGNPINDYDFFLKFVISARGSDCAYSPQEQKKKPSYATDGKTKCYDTGFFVAREG